MSKKAEWYDHTSTTPVKLHQMQDVTTPDGRRVKACRASDYDGDPCEHCAFDQDCKNTREHLPCSEGQLLILDEEHCILEDEVFWEEIKYEQSSG